MRAKFNRVFRRALFLFLIPLLYICAALVGGVWVKHPDVEPNAKLVVIWLGSGPIHTDILLPLSPRLRDRFDFLQGAGLPLDHPDARWLAVGRGSRKFYPITEGWPILTALRAGLGDRAVLRIDVIGSVTAGGGLTKMITSDAALNRLEQQILNEFENQRPMPLSGFTETDQFFPAKGRFSIFNTCNTWVGTQFRMAGIAFGRWTPLVQSIDLSLWRRG